MVSVVPVFLPGTLAGSTLWTASEIETPLREMQSSTLFPELSPLTDEGVSFLVTQFCEFGSSPLFFVMSQK